MCAVPIQAQCGGKIEIATCPHFVPASAMVLDAWFELNQTRIQNVTDPNGVAMPFRRWATHELDGARIQCRALIQHENGDNRLINYTVHIVSVEGKFLPMISATMNAINIVLCRLWRSHH